MIRGRAGVLHVLALSGRVARPEGHHRFGCSGQRQFTSFRNRRELLLQPAARVATGRPEQSPDGGKEGGPSGRNKRWDREGRAEGLGSLAGGSYGALDI